jgi:fermentation-respiration switch protein FrsA (DUF1100 family)
MPTIRVPTYVLHGRRDETVPVAVAEELKTRFDDLVELDVVDDDHALANSADRALEATRRMIDHVGLREERAREVA